MTPVRFESVPIQESHEPLVDISSYDFILEPSYFNQGLSNEKTILLRKTVVDKLLFVQSTLKTYKLKIWDGYRSRDVQQKIYQKYWNELYRQNPTWDDERLQSEVSVYVTNPYIPDRIPPHTTGGAVDLTIVDLQGRELEMGTSFDYFGLEASSLYYEETDTNDLIKANRRVLREAMISSDFRFDKDEWWHFDHGNQIWALELYKPYAIYGEVFV